MRNPVLHMQKQRHRSAAQIHSNFGFRCSDSRITLVSVPDVSSLYLVFFCLSWSYTSNTDFFLKRQGSSFNNN